MSLSGQTKQCHTKRAMITMITMIKGQGLMSLSGHTEQCHTKRAMITMIKGQGPMSLSGHTEKCHTKRAMITMITMIKGQGLMSLSGHTEQCHTKRAMITMIKGQSPLSLNRPWTINNYYQLGPSTRLGRGWNAHYQNLTLSIIMMAQPTIIC